MNGILFEWNFGFPERETGNQNTKSIENFIEMIIKIQLKFEINSRVLLDNNRWRYKCGVIIRTHAKP